MYVIAAISLGLLGSLHCIGMCGPIALALPVASYNGFSKIISILVYNTGRVITYSLFGVLFGLLGAGFGFFGFQQILSIILGAVILIFLFVPKKISDRFKITHFIFRKLNWLKSLLQTLMKRRSIPAFFLIGLLNGLLPCGLIYIAIAGATVTGSWWNGALFMALFGLGTIPAMFSLSLFSNVISAKFRTVINRSMPYVISVMAVMMILRGMNLGIPYLSPQLEKDKSVSCCHSGKQIQKPASIPVCCKKK